MGVDWPTLGRGCVEGNAGGLVWCGTGWRSEGTSTLPLCTKTLASGLATMTRAGGLIRRPEEVLNSLAASGSRAGGAEGTGAVLLTGGGGSGADLGVSMGGGAN